MDHFWYRSENLEKGQESLAFWKTLNSQLLFIHGDLFMEKLKRDHPHFQKLSIPINLNAHLWEEISNAFAERNIFGEIAEKMIQSSFFENSKISPKSLVENKSEFFREAVQFLPRQLFFERLRHKTEISRRLSFCFQLIEHLKQ